MSASSMMLGHKHTQTRMHAQSDHVLSHLLSSHLIHLYRYLHLITHHTSNLFPFVGRTVLRVPLAFLVMMFQSAVSLHFRKFQHWWNSWEEIDWWTDFPKVYSIPDLVFGFGWDIITMWIEHNALHTNSLLDLVQIFSGLGSDLIEETFKLTFHELPCFENDEVSRAYLSETDDGGRNSGR